MVVACIALSVALGGTSFAAIQALPKNSVGTKQLKKNAVTNPKIKANAVNGAKVANNSLTGADVNEASLGTVPSATNATNATSATNATNATTAATATNALALGGIGPAGYAPRFFAKVNYSDANPTILAASPGVTANGEGALGFPHVVFPQSMTNCAVIGSGDTGSGNPIVRRSTSVFAGGAEVQLAIHDDAGTSIRANFDVIAVC
jgi:hypothetical protein